MVGMMVFLSLVISPRPNLAVVLDTRFLSIDIVLIFLTSFALTITRPEIWQRIYSAASGPHIDAGPGICSGIPQHTAACLCRVVFSHTAGVDDVQP
jgi:hypothetical protein